MVEYRESETSEYASMFSHLIFDLASNNDWNRTTKRRSGSSNCQNCGSRDVVATKFAACSYVFFPTLFRTICFRLARALASRAFAVPCDTSIAFAVSRMLKPSTARSLKARRKEGESRSEHWAMRSPNSSWRQISSGFGR